MTLVSNLLAMAGGIGLFLVGMQILTEGLRALAGGALRRTLARYTKSPVSGALTGAVTTAIIQSSSATTVTAVGFVGAGLLTFPHALGIIFGANIGTTLTGWLVALLGFKLKLGVLALPLVFTGAMLRLFGRKPLRNMGWALVGFSLLFIGIDIMQTGVSAFEGVITPADFPPNTMIGRLQLVFIGVFITLITQSSSAGVATAMVALAAGTISFPQAAAIVIGMDVGTTFTAALATLGGSAAMRQTGYAHVVYNILTGIMAFFLLDLYTLWIKGFGMLEAGTGNAQVAVAVFHTMFNTLGVILVLPFTRPFARLITHLVPDRGPRLSSMLDTKLLLDSEAAIDAALATVETIAKELFAILASLLGKRHDLYKMQGRLEEVERAILDTSDFVTKIRTDDTMENDSHSRHQEVMHVLDHLRRLHHRAMQAERIEGLSRGRRLQRLAFVLMKCLTAVTGADRTMAGAVARHHKLWIMMTRQHDSYRLHTIDQAAEQQASSQHLLKKLDSMRWLQRAAYHIWRISVHLPAKDVNISETVLTGHANATD